MIHCVQAPFGQPSLHLRLTAMLATVEVLKMHTYLNDSPPGEAGGRKKIHERRKRLQGAIAGSSAIWCTYICYS